MTFHTYTSTSMELGETLTITATLSTTAYVALRAKTNTEVTIRISPPGGCSPVVTKRNNPRTPSCKLSPLARTPPTKPVQRNLTTTQITDKDVLKGWVMLATQQSLPSWSIAWVSATAIPTSRICVMLESEVGAKSPASSPNFEEIDTIIEVSDKLEGRGDPIKFEIKTRSNNTYKIITNSFMTSGMRDLMATTMAKYSPNPASCNGKLATQSISTLSKKNTLTRANTPKPTLPLASNTPSSVNIPPKSIKPALFRTSTPFPDSPRSLIKPVPINPIRRLQERSASFEAIPSPPSYKSSLRPASVNVFEHMRRSCDSPKPHDPRSTARSPSKPSELSLNISPSDVMLVTSILTDCSNVHCESDFSTWDSDGDGASDFSESESEWENGASYRRSRAELPHFTNPLNDSDFEIRDLCELSKGLSPDLNLTLALGSASDTSSCFSEDMSDVDHTIAVDELCTDEFSDHSTMTSSVSSSGIFEGLTGNCIGIRGIQKAIKISADSDKNGSLCKMGKWEQQQQKRMEKEAKRATRLSKQIEKKERKREKADRNSISSATKKPFNARVKGCVRKLFGITATTEGEAH